MRAEAVFLPGNAVMEESSVLDCRGSLQAVGFSSSQGPNICEFSQKSLQAHNGISASSHGL